MTYMRKIVIKATVQMFSTKSAKRIRSDFVFLIVKTFFIADAISNKSYNSSI